MTPELWVAVISAAAAIGAALAGYVLTKRADREAQWRTEKLDRYKAFIASLSGTIEGESSPEGQEEFARACNNLSIFASRDVLAALDDFRAEISWRNQEKSIERHDRLYSALVFEIRKDIGLRPHDDKASFRVTLWASGRKTFPSS